MADIDEKLNLLRARFGEDLEDLPTFPEDGTLTTNGLSDEIFEALKEMFGIVFAEGSDQLNNLKADLGDTKALNIATKSQAPYKALAYLLAGLTKRPPPPAESEDDSAD